ncbi:hypothetical protein FE257_010582 [Aspergillus nanangensis]|uniref:Uncharacterized protein n=1 Tax=Aspergillus nanangensis TaxID=2582783 RepID=A0AAD4CJT5_ASPNN|nr:hypothetical protein FE257_010582 [Aspergillus nanangensis]
MVSPTNDVISITSPTTVNKTKLGVYLGKVFCSEVISVDSLQCYKPGRIVTAKVTESEADGVVHHLVDYLEAHEEPHSFLQTALECIENIQSRGNVPILAGGSTSLTIPILRQCIDNGKRLCVIMLNSPLPILQNRIERRVDQMIDEGLLDELRELLALEAAHLKEGPDFKRGIWKTIGYPEFYPYLTSSGGDGEPIPEEIFKACVAEMKMNTFSYARMQLNWSQETLVPMLQQNGVSYTRLMGSAVELRIARVGTEQGRQEHLNIPQDHRLLAEHNKPGGSPGHVQLRKDALIREDLQEVPGLGAVGEQVPGSP